MFGFGIHFFLSQPPLSFKWAGDCGAKIKKHLGFMTLCLESGV